MPSRSRFREITPWLALAAILLLTAWVRSRFLSIPLERDEGEYAYLAQLLLDGIPPYTEAYDMKMPGIFAAYALALATLGQTGIAIHLGLLLVHSATVLLIFLLGRKLVDATTGVVAAATQATLSLAPGIQGFAANAEHFLILPALAGILLLVHAADSRRPGPLLLGGAALGLAFLVKQHAVFFIAFGGAYLVGRELLRRPLAGSRIGSRTLLFATGVLVPIGAMLLAVVLLADFQKFWFWTVTVPRDYATAVPLPLGWDYLRERFAVVAAPALPLWCLAGVGLAAPAWSPRVRARSGFLLGFAVFSFLSTTPGLLFRPHYFLQLTPAAALLSGVAVSSIRDLLAETRFAGLTRAAQVSVVLLSVYHLLYGERTLLFAMSPSEASRYLYSLNPFPESVEIARYIRRNSSPDDRIAVLGSEPQIYFYAQRRSATPYILMYPLMEYHPHVLDMQREMIREVERWKPRYLVYVNVSTSWLQLPYSQTRILRWAEDYSKRNYRQVGLVEILSESETRYFWDDASSGRTPRSPHWVKVFERSDR